MLCKSADADCATALERLVGEAPDRRLNRINVLDFARRESLDEQRAITAFLHATQIGLLEMSWNALCPSCGGVLDANATLKTVRSKEYYCAFCACSAKPRSTTKQVGLGGKFEVISRESLLLSNNVLLVVAAGSVLLGTLYPLIIDALGMGKLSVGPPYFNSVFVPLMVPAVFLMGVGPIARWKKASLPELAVRLRWAFLASVVTRLILPFVLGKWKPLVALGLDARPLDSDNRYRQYLSNA